MRWIAEQSLWAVAPEKPMARSHQNRLLESVTGSIASAEADLLLGQSFLRRFNSWSIDNKRQVLLVKLKK